MLWVSICKLAEDTRLYNAVCDQERGGTTSLQLIGSDHCDVKSCLPDVIGIDEAFHTGSNSGPDSYHRCSSCVMMHHSDDSSTIPSVIAHCWFAKNLSPDKINLSTLKGEGQLTNLELDEEVLQSLLDLPTWLAINRVCCNKAAIRCCDYNTHIADNRGAKHNTLTTSS
ncbi:UHRF1-binding protein 1-like [Collichthys lucidus]|uniref:UHRF1-binding protein 1-like n=1 Tax=Collichthys lucidus TaxID=240159 RepID=A0A4U5VQF9_COLLU|nr:UHRF1-binding protein 1-like [Collichthys lucidus]